MSQPIPIAIAVVQHRDRFLIGRRPQGVVLGGYWEFPGGKVESGETPQQTAQRECQEETGLIVTVNDELLRHTQQYDHGSVELFFFACCLDDPQPAPQQPYRWVPRNELSRYDFPQGNERLLNQLLAAHKSSS